MGNNPIIPILTIDRIIHEPARMLIMSILYAASEVDFLFLLNETDLTKGNIATHTRKLEEEGYIKIKKEFIGKKTHSTYVMTTAGKKCFKAYCESMYDILINIYDYKQPPNV
jgi:DNA-binding MarR family transcriptional regulator